MPPYVQTTCRKSGVRTGAGAARRLRYVSPMLRTLTAILALGLGTAGCLARSDGAPADTPALVVERTPSDSGTRLRVLAPPGVKLSAVVKPRLRLRNGGTVLFDTTAVSVDSLYYTAPPAGWLAGPEADVRGELQAGICDEETATCRRVTVEI